MAIKEMLPYYATELLTLLTLRSLFILYYYISIRLSSLTLFPSTGHGTTKGNLNSKIRALIVTLNLFFPIAVLFFS